MLCKPFTHKKAREEEGKERGEKNFHAESKDGGKKEGKKKFHAESKDAKILLSINEILQLVVHKDFGEFARIMSPKTDSVLFFCFSTTCRRVLAPEAGFQIVQ